MSSRFSISNSVLAGTGIGPVSAVSHAGSAICGMRGGRTVAALAGSPDQTQTRPSCSMTGNGRSRAAGGMWPSGCAHALTGRVVAQTMIGAFEQTALDEPPLRQRHPLVAAALVERDDATLGGAPHHQWLFRNDLPLRPLRWKLVRQPGHIPGILYQHIGGH